MTKIPKKRRAFWQQLLDLLLRVTVPVAQAHEVADEVIKKSTLETPMETIRSMILDSLRQRNAPAAQRLEKRFERVKYVLNRVPSTKVSPAGEIYDEAASDELLESDKITAAELFFMEGREGRSWQRKRGHHDSTSTEMASEEYYED